MTNKKLSVAFLRNIRELAKVDIIDFFRKRVDSNLQCIEDLGTGTDFCLGMNLLFPNSCDASKIKKGTNLSETDRRINFTLLKKAFRTLGIDKNFPLESMMKNNFQSNFFFAQWFIRFFEANQESEKVKNNPKNGEMMRFKKGGARSVPKDAATAMNDERSFGIETPPVSFSKIVSKPQIPNQSLIYDKFGNVSAVNIIRKEETSQTDKNTTDNEEDQIKGLLEVQQLLKRINIERKEYVAKLQEENGTISKSLEQDTLKKTYFHKKLNLIEKLCDDCDSDTLRLSLRRVLYHEGLPM